MAGGVARPRAWPVTDPGLAARSGMDTFELAPLPADFAATVASLHRIAETLVASARKPDNEIALEATPGGFGTPEFEFAGARQRVRVEAAELVREVDGAEHRAPLGSLAEAGAIVADLLSAGVELDDSPLAVDPLASLALGALYEFGADVLAELVATAGPALTRPRRASGRSTSTSRSNSAPKPPGPVPTTASRPATRTTPSPTSTSAPGRRRSPASSGRPTASAAPSWATPSCWRRRTAAPRRSSSSRRDATR